jgi:CRISPR-associated protein Cas4
MPHEPPDAAEPLIPVRMLNEFVYCPRLAWLEWVDGDFEDNADTIEGRYRHRRVDHGAGVLPSQEDEDGRPFQSRSVELSDTELGLIAKIDVVEGKDGEVWPVDTKRGRPAPTPERAWPPERVQVCAQVLLLRANGMRCSRGYLYFSESRERVEVIVDPALERLTREAMRRPSHRGSRRPGTAAAGRQPKMQPLLPCRDLPAGRGEPSEQA